MRLLFESFQIALIITFQKNLVHTIELPASACKESISTVQSVNACPTNKKDHDAASKKMQCQNIPNMCKSFEYHCVLNEWLSGTVEVCATSIYIQSRKCAVFIAELQSIRAKYSTNCKTCPNVYNSSETYKYSECYDEVRRPLTSTYPSTTMMAEITLNHNTTSCLNNVTQTQTNGHGSRPVDDDNTNVIAIVVSVGMGLSIVAVAYCIWKRRRCPKTKRTEEKEMSVQAPTTSEEEEHLNKKESEETRG